MEDLLQRASTPLELKARERVFTLRGQSLIVGILNTTPDSFSDGGNWPTLGEQTARGRELRDQGADIIDIGGESAITGKEAVAWDVEIERVVPAIERLVEETGAAVSVDTFKPEVARAALAAGALMVNDVSGLNRPEMAEVCADCGAALVVMHTRVGPKRRLADPKYEDVVADVVDFLGERTERARKLGVPADRLVVDPGLDFSKTPAQTVEVLRSLPELHKLGYPVMLAASRKDFIGALTLRSPRDRLAGTLAAVDHGVTAGAQLLRVHDVPEARDFLAIRAALAGEVPVSGDLRLPESLRWERRGPENP